MPDLTTTVALKRSSGYANPRSDGDLLPIVYGDVTDGDGGQWQAVCIDTVNFVYAVAGCQLLSVADGNSVYVFDKDGVAIASGWTFDEADNYETNGVIATLTFTADQEANEPLTVKCKGRENGSGNLLTNPVDIARDWLVAFGGLDSAGDLDATAFDKAAKICTADGYAAAGLVAGDSTLADTLTDILSSFGGSWWISGGKVRPLITTSATIYSENAICGDIRPHNIRPESVTVEADLSWVVNRLAVSYRYNYVDATYQVDDDGAATQDAVSISIYGLQARSLELPWVRSATVAAAIQGRIVAAYDRPRLRVTVDQDSLENVALERGDLVAFTSDWVRSNFGGEVMNNQIMRVIRVTISLEAGSVQLLLLDTGYYRTKPALADGSYLFDGSATAGSQRDTREY